ncbi:hypothetical protein NIA69_00065 [Gemmiger formicilis]|nr:hypothetical protein [Gemmiger formicilis]
MATGETKIGISAWVSDLYDGVDAHMDADALNADENTVTIGKTPAQTMPLFRCWRRSNTRQTVQYLKSYCRTVWSF